MFPEFGQAPLCLELDLDSYEGSWTHVAAFRGRSGWLMAARATIQSEHDLMRGMLLVGCDEHENPIPAWRAAQLATCDWTGLADCREMPPLLLDELLCEEEGAFFARWQRQTNSALVDLHDRAQHDLAALDGGLAATLAHADREIADLQRRRRHPAATPDQRATLGQMIARIEGESDQAVADATARRHALRRRIDAAEEALWDRGDVLVEVEPMWCLQWQAAEPAYRPARGRSPCNRAHRTAGGAAVAPRGAVVTRVILPPEPAAKRQPVAGPVAREAPLPTVAAKTPRAARPPRAVPSHRPASDIVIPDDTAPVAAFRAALAQVAEALAGAHGSGERRRLRIQMAGLTQSLREAERRSRRAAPAGFLVPPMDAAVVAVRADPREGMQSPMRRGADIAVRPIDPSKVSR